MGHKPGSGLRNKAISDINNTVHLACDSKNTEIYIYVCNAISLKEILRYQYLPSNTAKSREFYSSLQLSTPRFRMHGRAAN